VRDLARAFLYTATLAAGVAILLTPIDDKWLWAVAIMFLIAHDD
jgi:hypothetical protein